MWISLYLGPQCFCCTILRDVIFVEACSASVISTTCILQHAMVCWVTADGPCCEPSFRTRQKLHFKNFNPAVNIAAQIFNLATQIIAVSYQLGTRHSLAVCHGLSCWLTAKYLIEYFSMFFLHIYRTEDPCTCIFHPYI
jgi:hypothetical protein